MSALDVQVGGDHYKKYKIQPMEYSMANGLDACQHTAIKYVTRFRDKGGIADLEKAKHCIDMLIEFERAGQVETTSLDSAEQTFEKAAAAVNSPTVPKGAHYYWPKTGDFFKVDGFNWLISNGNNWYSTVKPDPEVLAQLTPL